MFRPIVLSTLLSLACSGTPERPEAPPSVRLVELPDRTLVAELSAEEAARVEAILARMEPNEGWAVTPPPWDAALVVRGEDGGERVLWPAGVILRENRSDPWNRSLAGADGSLDPDVQDYRLRDEDEAWIWALFGRHLGPTEVKQYQMVEPMEGLFP